MACDFKLVTIIGIHSHETFHSAAEIEAVWTAAVSHRAFVAAALFQGGHDAPLSGQTFQPVRVEAAARDERARPKPPRKPPPASGPLRPRTPEDGQRPSTPEDGQPVTTR